MTSRADCMERRLKNDAYYPTDLGAWNFGKNGWDKREQIFQRIARRDENEDE